MSRTIATARLYASILWLVVAIVFDGVRETLPDDERTAGAFVSGMAWMFAILVVCLLLATMAWAKAHGVAL